MQYLKRFYLSNSPMTYHPKQITPAAQFLATKTENFYTKLKDFAEKLPNTTAEAVIAPEFLLTQGLRFTFDVRHPYRGLEGGAMELQGFAEGTLSSPKGDQSGESLAKKMLNLPLARPDSRPVKSIVDLYKRLGDAHGRATTMLKTSAVLTDCYFLYTPSQIWLAALHAADEPLARFYLETVFGADGVEGEVLENLQACAALLTSSAAGKPSDEEMKELRRIDKKLYKCRNPEKVDLVGAIEAQKRGSESKAATTGTEEKTTKRQKLEPNAPQKDGENIFGPSIQR